MRFIISISILSIFIGLSGCYKKYPEDDFISFRSSRNRLSDNRKYKCWLIKRCKINGNETSEEYFKNVPFVKLCFINNENDKSNVVGLTREGATHTDSLDFTMSSCGGTSCWYLHGRRKLYVSTFFLFPLEIQHDTTFYQDGSYKVRNTPLENYQDFEIIKLTNTKMKLNTNFNGREFEIEFEAE